MKKIVVGAALVLSLLGGVFGGLNIIKPQSRPAQESEAFKNVLEDIARITVVPHTAGSAENYAVRDMIVERAETLGLAAEILPFEMDVRELAAGMRDSYDNGSELFRNRIDGYILQGDYASVEDYARGMVNAGDADTLQLDNLLIKLDGTAPEGAVMFVSHYDHVKGAPGAADDGLAVACMLQLMEQLTENEPKNDVYFLFTDGEENGLLGAADFVKTQPSYAEEVNVLLNFEARGNRGAMLMFETSGNDYELVRRFAGNVPQPVTMSIATAIYSMMPNGTDYTEFKNAGYNGLNFAMIEGDENYHQPTDTLENLNKDSAWQYHQTISALGEYFGNTDLLQIEHTQKALYFPLPLTGIVVLPGWLGYLIGFLPLVLAALLIVYTARDSAGHRGRKSFRIAGLLLMGVLPAVVTCFFFPGSYMFSVPALLFLGADLAAGKSKSTRLAAGTVLLIAALFVCGTLYAPLAVLVQVALKLWYATAVLAVLPLLPAVAYSRKFLSAV